MSVKFSNNGHSTLAASLTSSATSITVASGHGARFPSLSSGEYFYATLIDASNNLEIVKVTARSSDVLTVTRAQESTTARAFAIGDRIELRVTAQGLADFRTIAADEIVNSMIATDAVNSDSIAANSVTASELNVSGNGTAGQALLSDGDGSFSYGTGGDSFGTENGTYVDVGTFAGSYSANTIRTVTIPAGKYFVLFTTSMAMNLPNNDPDGFEVHYREDGTTVFNNAHTEGSQGPVTSRTTCGHRTFSGSVTVTVHVPAGGDGDAGGAHVHSFLKLIKLD